MAGTATRGAFSRMTPLSRADPALSPLPASPRAYNALVALSAGRTAARRARARQADEERARIETGQADLLAFVRTLPDEHMLIADVAGVGRGARRDEASRGGGHVRHGRVRSLAEHAHAVGLGHEGPRDVAAGRRVQPCAKWRSANRCGARSSKARADESDDGSADGAAGAPSRTVRIGVSRQRTQRMVAVPGNEVYASSIGTPGRAPCAASCIYRSISRWLFSSAAYFRCCSFRLADTFLCSLRNFGSYPTPNMGQP